MLLRLSKKIRYVIEMSSLYPYFMKRLMVKIRTFFKRRPLYPYEESYQFDRETQEKLDQMKDLIPPQNRGDSPVFQANWSSVFERQRLAHQVAESVEQVIGRNHLKGELNSLEMLRNIGCVLLQNKKLSHKTTDQILTYFENHKVYPSHVAHFTLHRPMPKKWVEEKEPFGCYDIKTILGAPHIVSFLTDPEVVGLVADYFGCLPTLSSLNLFWSFVAKKKIAQGSQRFHRDVNDYKTLTLLINLTDTTADDGAHAYIEKSHDYPAITEIFQDNLNDTLPKDLNPLNRRLRADDFFKLPLNGYGFDRLYEHFFRNHIVKIYGEKGTVVLTDNYGIHRGIPPQRKERLLLWVSYSLTAVDTVSVSVKSQQRIHRSQIKTVDDTAANRYILRNIVDFQ